MDGKDNENEKEENKGSFGKKLLIGLGAALGATAVVIGGKLAYDHFSKKKKIFGESALEYKDIEENDSVIKKLQKQRSLKAKIVDNTNNNNYIRANSITEYDENKNEDEFKCPITKKIMEDPVITPYGTTYEKSAIIDWIKKNKTDFKTKQVLEEDMLVTNYILKVAIKDYKESLNNL